MIGEIVANNNGHTFKQISHIRKNEMSSERILCIQNHSHIRGRDVKRKENKIIIKTINSTKIRVFDI